MINNAQRMNVSPSKLFESKHMPTTTFINSSKKNPVKQNLTFYEGRWKQILVNLLSTRPSPKDMCSKKVNGFSRPSTSGAGKAWKDYPLDELLISLPQTVSRVR